MTAEHVEKTFADPVRKKKTFAGVEIKSQDEGTFEAVFSTLNVIDKDGDWTPPGAFQEGQSVMISQYDHSIWEGYPPVGKGTIHQVGDTQVVKGQMFLGTQAGREHFELLKAMGSDQQWSYGYHAKSTKGETPEGPASILSDINVYEVSPVFIGAGVGTRTLVTKTDKGLKFADEAQSVRDALESLIDRADAIVKRRREENGRGLGVESAGQLKEIADVAERIGAVLAEPEPTETGEEQPEASNPEQPDYSSELRAALMRFMYTTRTEEDD